MAKPKFSLEERLKAWDEAAPANRGNRTWLRHTSAVGAALAMATDAGAGSIAYSGIQNKNVGASQASAVGFGPGSFVLGIASGGGNVSAFLSANKGLGLLRSATDVWKLASGAAISSGAGTFQSANGVVRFSATAGWHGGDFSAGQSGFAGVDFQTGTGLNQKTYYGWLRLVYTGGPPNSLTAVDWAYETTPGLAIHAGQTAEPGGTPEPGTAALSMLALGAAGVLALRRRKR